jgi:threonine dehydratase
VRIVRNFARRASAVWPVDPRLIDDVGARFADARLVPTTLARARPLDLLADLSGKARVWLAMECLQVTGSFKVRGALVGMAEARRTGGKDVHVVVASAGNHAAGVAYAAHVLGMHVTIVMPSGAPEAKKARALRYGAELCFTPSASYDDAEEHALSLAKERGSAFLSPYDDPFVAAGNGGSIGFEVRRALGRAPELVLAPFGGGGLASGLGWSLGSTTDVWGVQSEVSAAMALSLESGKAKTRLDAAEPTLAEGLEGGISDSGFARAREQVAGVLVVKEAAIAHAMAFAFRELGLALEGSAATALVPILAGLPAPLARTSPIDVVVVLTGRNVDRERLLRVSALDE